MNITKENVENFVPTGLHISYYFICRRKLWLYTHGISYESGDENVAIGRLIDEESYSREKKNILIDGVVNIDFIHNGTLVSEIKKSDKLEEAHIWQLKYYLYYLKKKGIDIKGVLCYPKMRERKEVVLTDEDKIKFEQDILPKIKQIVSSQQGPAAEKKNFCKRCAYFQFCFV